MPVAIAPAFTNAALKLPLLGVQNPPELTVKLADVSAVLFNPFFCSITLVVQIIPFTAKLFKLDIKLPIFLFITY
jgi:hypothetical protein